MASTCTEEIGKGGFGVAYKAGEYVIKCFKDTSELTAKKAQDIELNANEIVYKAIPADVYAKHTPLIPSGKETKMKADLECSAPEPCEYSVITRGGKRVTNLHDACNNAALKKNFILRGDKGKELIAKLLESVYNVVNSLKNARTGPYYHSDIKPANVFLALDDRSDLHVRLGDFGLLSDANSTELRGTPHYMGFFFDRRNRQVINRPVGTAADVEMFNSLLAVVKEHGTYYVFSDPWQRTIYSIALSLLEVYEKCPELDYTVKLNLYRQVLHLAERLENNPEKVDLDILPLPPSVIEREKKATPPPRPAQYDMIVRENVIDSDPSTPASSARSAVTLPFMDADEDSDADAAVTLPLMDADEDADADDQFFSAIPVAGPLALVPSGDVEQPPTAEGDGKATKRVGLRKRLGKAIVTYAAKLKPKRGGTGSTMVDGWSAHAFRDPPPAPRSPLAHMTPDLEALLDGAFVRLDPVPDLTKTIPRTTALEPRALTPEDIQKYNDKMNGVTTSGGSASASNRTTSWVGIASGLAVVLAAAFLR